jgi:hypothetical protein
VSFACGAASRGRTCAGGAVLCRRGRCSAAGVVAARDAMGGKGALVRERHAMQVRDLDVFG